VTEVVNHAKEKAMDIDQGYGLSRRAFFRQVGFAASAASAAGTLALPNAVAGTPPPKQASKVALTYDTAARGVRIFPGEWRPHYPWEHIAWVSPAWPSQEYIWLDFPEAIFCNLGLIFLSHVDPPMDIPLPQVKWSNIPNGIAYDRQLPNGVRFGGSVVKGNEATVDLELHLYNGTSKPLTNITLQTCSYLHGIHEFSDLTNDNKFVHLADEGWVTLSWAKTMPTRPAEPYGIGWRTKGKRLADLPVNITKSNLADRYVAMTWYKDTISMIGNPNFPCMHADPRFHDLNPGESASIHGKLIFFEGKLSDFDYLKF
jgi:hypothetical protein